MKRTLQIIGIGLFSAVAFLLLFLDTGTHVYSDAGPTLTPASQDIIIQADNLERLYPVHQFQVEAPLEVKWSIDNTSLFVIDGDSTHRYSRTDWQDDGTISIERSNYDLSDDDELVASCFTWDFIGITSLSSRNEDSLIRVCDPCHALDFRPETHQIAYINRGAGTDAWLRLLDAETGEMLSEASLLSLPMVVEFSPDGDIVVVAYEDVEYSNILRRWAVIDDELQPLEPFEIDEYGTRAVTFSPDGETFAYAGYYTMRIVLLDSETGEELNSFQGTGELITQVDFNPDGSLLVATGGYDSVVQIWDVSTGKLLKTLNGEEGTFAGSATFSPDGQFLATTIGDTVTIWGIKP